jgi:diguanylate cyclase (GGDEF)-like protein
MLVRALAPGRTLLTVDIASALQGRRRRRRSSLRRPRSVIIASGALLSLLMVACVGWFTQTSRVAAMNDAQRELMSLSRALAEDTDRALAGADVLQTDIVDRIKALGVEAPGELATATGSLEMHEMLRQKISDLRYLDAVTIIDADGDLVNFSRAWPVPKVNVADRDYFKALKSDPTRRDFVGEPVRNRANGTWTIYLANPITGADGAFVGVILAAMKVDYFESAYSSFAMPGGRVSLFRNNGTLLARAPHVESEYVKDYGVLPIFYDKLPQSEGAITLRSLSDGKGTERLLAFSKLPRYGLVMTVSKSVAEILADWTQLSRIFYLVAVLIVGMIVTTVLILLRLMDQQRRMIEADRARAAAELEISTQAEIVKHAGRFEVALNNMLQGLCMFDVHERLIVCNARYAQMYALPEALTRPGVPWRDILTHRLATFGYRDLDIDDVLAQHEATDLRSTATSSTRELGDGRIILIRHQPIPEGGWVTTHEDITERRKADERLAHMARHDALTGLPNRVLLQERLERAVGRLAQGEQFAVLCLDLDHFKEINDTLGHPVGDALLRDFAGRLQAAVRDTDTVARIGGDEFAIVQGAIGDPAEAGDLARRVLELVAEPCEIAGHPIDIGVSIGIACAPRDDEEGGLLLRKADIALYRAKAEGRRDYRFFEPAMDAELQARRRLEVDIRKALREEEFEVYYQPLLDARTRAVRSFEALVRWRYPYRGIISPIEFIPLAEETGLIVPLGEWVLKAACREAAKWPADVSVTVNLSAAQFKTPNLVDTVVAALLAAGISGRRLELEITESVLLCENKRTLEVLHALRRMGVRIAMDDFGTGYSSLSYLRSFPFDKIKIDKSFVQNLDQRDSQEIVRAISALGQTLRMTTTAEGVETEAQLAAVIETGCVEAQGNLFSKPVPAAEVAALLGRFHQALQAA